MISATCKVCGKSHQTHEDSDLFIQHFCSKNHAEKWLANNTGCDLEWRAQNSSDYLNQKLKEEGFGDSQ